MIIDAHIHAGPLLTAAPFPTICDAGTGDALVRLMDRAGIERAVVFAPPWKGGVCDPTYAMSNREIWRLQQRFPDRLLGAARVSPNYGEPAVAEARRCLEEYGLRAVKLNSDWEAFRVAGTAVVDAILDLAAGLRCPVIVHCGDAPRSQPAALLDVVRRFPSLRVVLAHTGHEFSEDAIWMAAAFDNVYVDTSEARMSVVARAIAAAPSHKVLYGSDIPYHLPEVELAKIRLLPGVSTQTRDRVLGANALRLFWGEGA